MIEHKVNEMGEVGDEVARGAIPRSVPKGENNRVGRHLRWYERQWGAGFIAGLEAGAMIGVVISVPIMFLAKWLVEKWVG